MAPKTESGGDGLRSALERMEFILLRFLHWSLPGTLLDHLLSQNPEGCHWQLQPCFSTYGPSSSSTWGLPVNAQPQACPGPAGSDAQVTYVPIRVLEALAYGAA